MVRDDGRGFDPAVILADHFGLAIMRERMAAVGGTVALASAPGEGTTVTTLALIGLRPATAARMI